ncbi:zinc ribbon domain-containing protein [Edaphobacter sp.]|uniref:zinc ribbon domain-containing protein n=1 Tax=Edaphobacter sp. TaxID=1934404 RepID=UPI002DBD32ED|nr:C4-type zinc ribbon domain-containing protein [Edaphobacter sp.]HEU5342613.1 C4-type zinc ribbon domain-containing protein [Edaphobacter sp.]
MHPDLERLIVLQRHDIEAKRLREEMAALPTQVAHLEAKLKAAIERRTETADSIAKEEGLRRHQESDIKDQQAKIAKVRKQLDMATTTVQVTSFEHEISFAQSEISRLEDAELESMERGESLAAQKFEADESVVSAEKNLEREQARAAETMAQDKAALAAVEEKRVAVRAEVGEDALSMYDRIAKSKGVAVSEGVDQKCSVCQMLLRPQKWNDLRDRDNNETMMTCESCGRLLYYDPARDAPQRKTVQSESIAASIVRSSL